MVVIVVRKSPIDCHVATAIVTAVVVTAIVVSVVVSISVVACADNMRHNPPFLYYSCGQSQVLNPGILLLS